jgi:hypothetical protein
MTDFANHAAAVAAGYVRIQNVHSAAPRYLSIYEKQLVGEPGSSGFMFRAEGSSDVDQNTADALALTALKTHALIATALEAKPPVQARGAAR